MALGPFSNLGRGIGRWAEDDNKSPKDQDQDDAKKGRKAKRAKGEAEDDEEDEDDEKGGEQDKKDEKEPKAKAARARERARVRAIFTSGPGLANPVVAAHMALDTDMPRSKAIAAIGSLNAAVGARDAADAEADFQARPDVAMANVILAAGAKARGEEPKAIIPPGRRERMGYREGEAPAPAASKSMADRIIAAGRKARGET